MAWVVIAMRTRHKRATRIARKVVKRRRYSIVKSDWRVLLLFQPHINASTAALVREKNIPYTTIAFTSIRQMGNLLTAKAWNPTVLL